MTPILYTSEAAYLAVAILGLVLFRRLDQAGKLIVAGFLVSAVFIVVQMSTTGWENHALNHIWPRLQCGLFLAALTRHHKYRVALTAAPIAVASWAWVIWQGTSFVGERVVEVTTFGAVAYLAATHKDRLLRWAMQVYAVPAIIFAPSLAILASRGDWTPWLLMFQFVHAGRIVGILLCAWWLLRPQLEPCPALQAA